jgi:hypothetical protein
VTEKLLTVALLALSTCRECPFAQVGLLMHALQQRQKLSHSEFFWLVMISVLPL